MLPSRIILRQTLKDEIMAALTEPPENTYYAEVAAPFLTPHPRPRARAPEMPQIFRPDVHPGCEL